MKENLVNFPIVWEKRAEERTTRVDECVEHTVCCVHDEAGRNEKLNFPHIAHFFALLFRRSPFLLFFFDCAAAHSST